VPVPWKDRGGCSSSLGEDNEEVDTVKGQAKPRPKRAARVPSLQKDTTIEEQRPKEKKRRPVAQRWVYEPVTMPPVPVLLSAPVSYGTPPGGASLAGEELPEQQGPTRGPGCENSSVLQLCVDPV
jgi:hypothetical protein